MPYVPKSKRLELEPELEYLLQGIGTKGDLTYCVYYLALKIAQRRGMNYTNISTAISCLADAEAELRRRHLDPYEDEKIKENGDIL